MIEFDDNKFTQEDLARIIRNHIYNSFGISLGGGIFPAKSAFCNRAQDPRPGNLVIESSTIWDRRRSSLDSVGILLRISEEPVDFGPGAEWNEETDGPHPTETVYYIKTFDGREFRWTNACFIAAVGELISGGGLELYAYGSPDTLRVQVAEQKNEIARLNAEVNEWRRRWLQASRHHDY